MDDVTAEAWATEELVRLIEIRSISDHEHEVMAYLATRCAELGMPATTQPIEGAGPNLLVRWDDGSDPVDLLLTAHMDTIDPAWDWHDRAAIEGSVVTGLGAQDDKGCAVAILLGALLAREQGVPLERLPVALGFVVDEEVHGKGSRAMADTLRPRFVVASEGTELDLAIVETGFVDGWVHVYGESRHGSLAEEADNAVIKAARLLLELLELPFTKGSHPIAGANAATVHQIESSAAMNAIPDRADMLVMCRVFESPSVEEVEAQVQALCSRYGATFERVDGGGWWSTPTDAPLVQAMQRASEAAIGRAPAFTRMPCWTDAHSFSDRCGSEVLVFGPGHLRTAHRPDEHIDVREIVRSARVFAALLADAGSLASAAPTRTKEEAR